MQNTALSKPQSVKEHSLSKVHPTTIEANHPKTTPYKLPINPIKNLSKFTQNDLINHQKFLVLSLNATLLKYPLTPSQPHTLCAQLDVECRAKNQDTGGGMEELDGVSRMSSVGYTK